jgi:hypothetical protein
MAAVQVQAMADRSAAHANAYAAPVGSRMLAGESEWRTYAPAAAPAESSPV